MECVIFDLDGTLADVRHRLPLIKKKPPDWAAFFDAGSGDPVIESSVRLLEMIHWYGREYGEGFEVSPRIFVCSGRPDSHRSQAEEWLTRVLGDVSKFVTLLMRAAGDHRPDYIIKKEMLDGIRGQGYKPLFSVDDRPSVVKMWRAEGVPCFAADDAPWQGESHVIHGPEVEGKTLLTLLVGPSGAGKTSWVAGRRPIHKSGRVDDPVYPDVDYRIMAHHVLSSDNFRLDMCGDWRDQSRNAEVFAALHDAARARLRYALPVVLDATNLRRKHRLGAASLAPEGTRVRYVVLNRSLEDKLAGAADGMAEVIRKHDHIFRSQLRDILSGDALPNVDVVDLREDA